MRAIETTSSQQAQLASLEFQRLIRERMRMEEESRRLKQELETLEDRVEECRADIVKYEDQKLYPALEAHGRLLCLPLCEALLTTLPPELRNMVYLHLCPPAHVQIDRCDDQHVRKDTSTESCAHPPPPFQAEYSKAPHWWRVDFVGQSFLDELVQHWYRTSTFIIDAHNSNDVRRLLNENPWRLDTPPKDVRRLLKGLISNLSISVWTDLFGKETKLAGYKGTLKEVLGLTRTLKETARICVNFRSPWLGPLRDADRRRAEEAKTDQVLRAMTTVFPLLKRLRGPVRGEVDGVVFHDDLTKLSLDAWKTEYLLSKKMGDRLGSP